MAPRASMDKVEAGWPQETLWTQWGLVGTRAPMDKVEAGWPPEPVWTQCRLRDLQSLCGHSGGWVTPTICVDTVEKTKISVLNRNSYRACWEIN